MNVGIIGAGFTGLTAGYELLKKGHKVTILERDDKPGGLAMGFKKPEWDWSIEKHYHHIFTGDKSIQKLAQEIGVPFIFKRPITSSLIDNEILQLDSPLKLLQFQALSIPERLRMGMVLAYLKYASHWENLEQYSAHEWLQSNLGKRPYSILWEPLLKAKFGNYYQDISLAWFWARIKARSTQLGYPEGGFQRLAEQLAKKVKEQSGEIHYSTVVDQISPLQQGFEIRSSLSRNLQFDSILLTVPNIFISKLVPSFPKEYHQKLQSFKGIGAVNMILVLKKPFFKNNVYWLNICDEDYPFLAVVEHTNFITEDHYNGEHIVYVGNYLPNTHEYFSLSEDELLDRYDSHLVRLNKSYKKSIKSIHVFKVPFAQPIVTQNYSQKILDFETPIPHIYISNMQQIYPWDRGTNYAVSWGQKLAEYMHTRSK